MIHLSYTAMAVLAREYGISFYPKKHLAHAFDAFLSNKIQWLNYFY